MTEETWLRMTTPTVQLLGFMEERVSDRKRRLFAVACCYLAWDHLGSEGLRRGVEAAELLADGKVTTQKVKALRRAVEPDLRGGYEYRDAARHAVHYTLIVAKHLNGITAAAHCATAVGYSAAGEQAAYSSPERKRQEEGHMRLLRDVLGNPFRPVVFEEGWRTTTTTALVTGIYEEKVFDRMPILADALEEAGCDSREVLDHCRGPGEHVRGCWVVDLVLGKG